MDSEKLSSSIMYKLESLKLLDKLDEHVKKSIGLIIEETIDHNIAKVKPRKQYLKPTIVYDRCEVDVKGGPPFSKMSRYKFHVMSVGDVLRVEEKYELAVHQAFNNYIKKHKPKWGYSKTKDGYGMVSFKRIK